MDKIIARLKSQYEAFENELNVIEDSEDGMIDIDLACSLAESVPYLIKQLEEKQAELDRSEQRYDEQLEEAQRTYDYFKNVNAESKAEERLAHYEFFEQHTLSGEEKRIFRIAYYSGWYDRVGDEGGK